MEPISVFLVDDNPRFLRAEKRFLLSSEGIEIVGQATNGKQALIQARQLRPQIILLDIAMPDISGIDLIPRLQAALPQTGIITLTLLDTGSYRQAALAAGADAFLSKATLFSDLLPTIQRTARLKRLSQMEAPSNSKESPLS